MSGLIEYQGYKPVASGKFAGCRGCVFEDNRKNLDCITVVCFPGDFPEDHDLHKAPNVIWIKES